MTPVTEFEHYLQRSLSPDEWNVIAPLEQMRLHGRSVRAIIADYTDFDSRPVLCAYMRFLHECIFTYPDAMVMGATRAEAEEMMGYDRGRDEQWLSIGTGQSPDSLRGHAYRLALLLDSDCYAIDEDTACELQYMAIQNVLGTILDLPGFVLIIHTHTECPYTNFPTNPTLQEETKEEPHITSQVPPCHCRGARSCAHRHSPPRPPRPPRPTSPSTHSPAQESGATATPRPRHPQEADLQPTHRHFVSPRRNVSARHGLLYISSHPVAA